MNIVSWSVTGVICATLLFGTMAGCGTLNREATIRTAMEAKQKANTTDFDTMKKVIAGVAEVGAFELDKLKEIFVEHAEARRGEGKAAIMSWVQESVPNINTQTMSKLVNIIESQRVAFSQRQKELIDLQREQHLMFNKIPGGWFLTALGRFKMDIQIVTSSETKEAFATGEENETKLFPSKNTEKVEK